jgi:hypothetical protein
MVFCDYVYNFLVVSLFIRSVDILMIYGLLISISINVPAIAVPALTCCLIHLVDVVVYNIPSLTAVKG